MKKTALMSPASTMQGNGLVYLVLLIILLFVTIKIVLNTDFLGTDTTKQLSTSDLVRINDKAYGIKDKVFGDLEEGMYPAAKVYENGKKLGLSVNWHGDLLDFGKGRIFHNDNKVAFSTSDNSTPILNGKTYALAYNSLAWLNIDWISLGLLFVLFILVRQYGTGYLADKLKASPSPWLLLFMVDRFLTTVSSPNFSLYLVPDSNSYINASNALGALASTLSQPRTIGYPLFYSIVPDILIPTAQLFIFFGSIFILYMGLKSISHRPWIVLLCCLPMVTINGTYRLDTIAFTNELIPDALALSFSLAATGFCLLFLSKHKNRVLSLCLCALATLYAYQLKPSYLFMLIYIPALSIGWTVMSGKKEWLRRLTKDLIPLVGITLIPFLLFCGLRFATVNHFGLVSYGGNQLIGLAGVFLDPETIQELPEDMKPFAIKVARHIDGMGGIAPSHINPENLSRHIWQYYDAIIYNNGGIRKVCDDRIRCNTQLASLSKTILSIHFDKYCFWLWEAFKHSTAKAIELGRWYHIALTFLSISSVLLAVAIIRSGNIKQTLRNAVATVFQKDMLMLLWSTALMFLMSVSVVILVIYPLSRYLLPARILLLPTLLCLAGAMFQTGVGLWTESGGHQSEKAKSPAKQQAD